MNPITESINSLLSYELSQHAQEYTQELRKAAMDAGWPVIIYTQLSIGVSDGAYTILYPDSIAEAVETLEFGDGHIPPNPIMRNFIRTIPTKRELVR